jgi:hypothetical protein
MGAKWRILLGQWEALKQFCQLSPADSYRKYVSCTPIKLQPARKWTDVLEGHAVDPEAQKEAAPFLNECAPISSF